MVKRARSNRTRSGSDDENLRLHTFSGLAATLKKWDPFLYHRVETIYQVAVREFYSFQTPPGYTDHGSRHILAVLSYADQLVTGRVKSDSFTKGEIFLLLSSIFLHDVGRLRHDFNYKESRGQHGEESAKIILEQRPKFTLDSHEADLVAKICRSHCVADYQRLAPREWSVASLGKCDIHTIMAILRIADVLDLTYLRTPSFVYPLKKFQYKSKRIWKRHQCISDVLVDSDLGDIAIYAKPQTIKQNDDIENYCTWVKSQVEEVRDDFLRKNLYYTVRSVIDPAIFSKPVNPTPSSNPFVRLSPFTAAEADVFFGRKQEIESIVALSEKYPFLAVTGYSGVGKTSLLEAGVFPHLRFVGGSTTTYRIETPTEETLSSCIHGALGLTLGCSDEEVRASLDELGVENRKLYIHIDQFEELFTVTGLESDRKGLADVVSRFLDSDLPDSIRFIATIRADFLPHLWEMRLLNPVFFRTENLTWVKILSPEQARMAIEKPLMRFSNLRWAPGLIRSLIIDLPDVETPGAYPPFVQLVCHKLVAEKLNDIKRLSVDERIADFNIGFDLYRKFGPASRIIEEYFKTILDGFSLKERSVLDQILSRMITDFGSKRPITKDTIDKINQNRINANSVMNRLINARVVTKGPAGFELEHDILAKKLVTIIREGPKASSLVIENIEFMRKNVHRPLTLEQLSKQAEISVSQLVRRFNKETERTPMQYLQYVRVEEAKTLLRDAQNTVAHIANRCGFKSAAHFSQVFDRIQGGSPLSYRRISREDHRREFEDASPPRFSQSAS